MFHAFGCFGCCAWRVHVDAPKWVHVGSLIFATLVGAHEIRHSRHSKSLEAIGTDKDVKVGTLVHDGQVVGLWGFIDCESLLLIGNGGGMWNHD